MNPEFTYFAHISYIPEDEAFAKKMKQQLEHYRLPGRLARHFPHLPRKIRPVCCNTPTAAGGGSREALAASRYLIVICTPTSAQPDAAGTYPLDGDIDAFLSLRAENAERVISIIFPPKDGTQAKDCLSPALLALNVLAANVREKGTERTLNDVVAKMLNLSPDTLWDRRRREQLRNRWLGGTGAALAAGLTAAAGWYWWDYNTPHVSYYADYIERNNLPEGLFPLSEEEMSRRTIHYRFTHCKRKLQKVEYCSSSGRRFEHLLPWNSSRPSGMKFEYISNTGELTGCTLLDTAGETTEHLSFSGNDIDFKKRLKGGTSNNRGVSRSYSYNFDTAFAETFGDSVFERTTVQRNAAGLVTRRLFYRQNSGAPAFDAQGISGLEYELDEMGRIISERYIRQVSGEGERVVPATTPCGVAGMRFTYGENGLISTVTCIDREGNPIMNDNQWAQVAISHNSDGNQTSIQYLDTHGKPCTNGYGYSLGTTAHDEKGNEIEDRFFDTSGEPCTNKLFGGARIAYTYSKEGAIASISTFDANGNPCIGTMGYARINNTYNQQGNLVRVSYLGTDGKPCASAEGFAYSEIEYNEQGKIVLRQYLGTDGKPCANKDGVAQERSTYDDRGNQTGIAFLDTAGNSCTSKAGYAQLSALFHAENDNLIAISYYGADGGRCAGPEGYSRISWEYAPNGRLLKSECFDEKDAPCAGPDGNTRVEWTYNATGIPESATCTKPDGSYIRMLLDEQGTPTEQASFRADGSPLADEGGFIRLAVQHHAQTETTTVTAFMADGSHSRVTKDKLGRPVEQSIHDAQGKPIPNALGAVRVTTAYDAQGGVAGITSHRADGSYSTMSCKEAGTETAYFNADGTPSDAECGYARMCLGADADMGLLKMDKFDIRGNKVETVYITPKGQPQLCKKGYAQVKRRFDESGNCIEIALFDTTGAPCLDVDGCSSWKMSYNGANQVTEQRFFGLDGKPCLTLGGYATTTWKYDEKGNPTETAYYGLDGKPCLHAEGYARLVRKHGANGETTEEAYYGLHGEPRLCAEGYARASLRRDAAERSRERSFFGVDGKPCMSTHGYARIFLREDERGNIVEVAYFDTDGNPCGAGAMGASRTLITYDEEGNMVSCTSYDAEGNAIGGQ